MTGGTGLVYGNLTGEISTDLWGYITVIHEFHDTKGIGDMQFG
jgi:hypothetical protein